MSTSASRAQGLFQMIKHGAPSTQSAAWTHHVTSWYNALSDDEKNELLETLIAASGPHQMFMLQRKFPDLLFRDFIGLLPPELAVMILSYLDGDTLLTCCLVSRRWEDVISNLPCVWWNAARDNGVMMPPRKSADSESSLDFSNTTLDHQESSTNVQDLPNDKESGDNEIVIKDIENNDSSYKKESIQSSNNEIQHQKTDSTGSEENNLDPQSRMEAEQNSENGHLPKEKESVNDDNCLSDKAGPESDYVKSIRSDSQYVRDLYCHSKHVIQGFKKGKSVDINEQFIDKGAWRITSVKYQGGHIITGCDDHTVQVWDVRSGDLLTSVSTHSVCCLTTTPHHLYTASFNANAECWDLNTGQHSKTFVGHTSAVLAIDVSCDERFLLTGSVDRTAKLWDLHKASTEHLLKTFDDIHMDWVFQVKFLSQNESSLLLMSCDSMVACVWRVTLEGRVMSSSHVVADRSTKFTSFYLSPGSPANIPAHYSLTPGIWQSSGMPGSSNEIPPAPPALGTGAVETLSACQWTELAKASVFVQYSVDLQQGQLHRLKSFRINQEAIKAHLLGAGRRFAVIMCAISRRDFHILDIHKESVVATIATPDFYILTRNGSTVTLCDTSWLDGFDFPKMTSETPVFAASVALNRVMLGTWADFVSNVEYRRPDKLSQDSYSTSSFDSSDEPQKCCGRTISDTDTYDEDRRIIDEILRAQGVDVDAGRREGHLARRIADLMMGRDERLARRILLRVMGRGGPLPPFGPMHPDMDR